MSSGIAPVPTASAALVADRQAHHDRQDGDRNEAKGEASEDPSNAQESGTVVQFVAEPPANDAAVTFAASQLAERLKLVEANLRLLKLKTEGWKPPASELSLRDKTI